MYKWCNAPWAKNTRNKQLNTTIIMREGTNAPRRPCYQWLILNLMKARLVDTTPRTAILGTIIVLNLKCTKDQPNFWSKFEYLWIELSSWQTLPIKYRSCSSKSVILAASSAVLQTIAVGLFLSIIFLGGTPLSSIFLRALIPLVVTLGFLGHSSIVTFSPHGNIVHQFCPRKPSLWM